MTDENDLPDEIALLWGLRETPRRGRKPSLTINDITRAAIGIADAEGLGAVSMARVAQQLGNSTMALYRHVKSKDELLALMSEAALEMPPEIPADTDWRTGLTLWTNSVRKTLGKHPWYAHIPLNGPPAGPRNLAWLDSALGTLADTPLDEGDKIRIVMGLITFVHGDLRFSAQVMEGFQENPEAFGRSYSRALKVVVDPRKMPALGRLVAAGVFDYDNLYDEQFAEDDFAFSLNFYLDGVAAHMTRKG